MDDSYATRTAHKRAGDSQPVLGRIGPSDRLRRAKVREAQLELHTYSVSSAGSIGAYGVTREWVEGTCVSGACSNGVTWDGWNGGTGFGLKRVTTDAEPSSTTTVSAGGGEQWIGWDITSLVEAWSTGARPNHGLQLRSAQVEGTFESSDEFDPALRPRLVVSYACECGKACRAPRGSGNLLFVVDIANSPSAADQAKARVFAGWGYPVTLIDSSANQASFDAQMGSHDVVYLSSSVQNGELSGIELGSFPIGVVNENLSLVTQVGLASSGATSVGNSAAIVDASHEITAPFSPSTVRVFDRDLRWQRRADRSRSRGRASIGESECRAEGPASVQRRGHGRFHAPHE